MAGKDKSLARLVDYIAFGEGSGPPLAWADTSITVDLSGLAGEPEMLASARLAFDIWSNSAGFEFIEAAGGDITFGTELGGAYTGVETSKKGEILSSHINVATDWLSDRPIEDRWDVGDYGLMTFIHEIGHALGLNHPGRYFGRVTYEDDAIFAKDTWGYSIMSYFEQENFGGRETYHVSSPMLADLAAIQKLYGAIELRPGDTGYTYETMGLLGSEGTFVIADTGGRDSIDLRGGRGRGGDVDLRAGKFSTLGDHEDNVAIAVGTRIEKAFGSEAADRLRGDSADNTLSGEGGADVLVGGRGADRLVGGEGGDRLTGGAGYDVFVFRTPEEIAGDVIVDFQAGRDRLQLSAIDADVTTEGDQSFAFIGREGFSGVAGELRYRFNGEKTVLSADLDGDGARDFVLTLEGRVHFEARDFVL